MQYKRLGQSDLNVSELCLGTMTWGEQNSEAEAHAQLDYALEKGINFIDAAEMYPVPPRPETQGLTEEYIGSWLHQKQCRSDVVLATKVAGPGDWLSHIRNGPQLTKEQISTACESSLCRLGTDYIDLYQIHWPSRTTNFFGELAYKAEGAKEGVPLRDTLEAVKKLLAEGKIRHWGLSNETPWGVAESLRLARELDMSPPASIQNPYNLLNRTFEVGLAEFSHRSNVPLLAYSPLAFGVLSGKYIDGARPTGARITMFSRFSRYTHEKAEAAVLAYRDLANAHGISLVDLSLAFVTNQAFVASNIIGATSLAQLEQNIKTHEISLSDALKADLDALHKEHLFPCP